MPIIFVLKLGSSVCYSHLLNMYQGTRKWVDATSSLEFNELDLPPLLGRNRVWRHTCQNGAIAIWPMAMWTNIEHIFNAKEKRYVNARHMEKPKPSVGAILALTQLCRSQFSSFCRK